MALLTPGSGRSNEEGSRDSGLSGTNLQLAQIAFKVLTTTGGDSTWALRVCPRRLGGGASYAQVRARIDLRGQSRDGRRIVSVESYDTAQGFSGG